MLKAIQNSIDWQIIVGVTISIGIVLSVEWVVNHICGERYCKCSDPTIIKHSDKYYQCGYCKREIRMGEKK